jgi:hypothetical protein
LCYTKYDGGRVSIGLSLGTPRLRGDVMGLFSWFSSTARKSAAAAALQAYYEICKHHGHFRGDPVKFANRIVATACDRLPDLAESNHKPYILAAASVTVVMVDEGVEAENAGLYALGLGAMLQAVLADPRFTPSSAEEKIMDAASVVLQRWNDRQSPFLSGMGFDTETAPTASSRTGQQQRAVPETFQGREREMEELIRRVNQ